MSTKVYEELIERERLAREKRKQLDQQKKQKDLFSSVPEAPSTLTPETIDSLNNAIKEYHGLKADIAQAKADQETKTAEGTAASVGTELGTGFGLSFATKGGARTAKVAKDIKKAINAVRAARTGAMAVAGTPTPWTIIGGTLAVGATEALSWGLANVAGQYVRKSYGLGPEEMSAAEVMSAAAFGIISTPADKFMVGRGRRFLAKRIPLKLTDDKIGKAFKTRQVVIKGVSTTVSGAVLGVAETELRNAVAIKLNEEGASRDAMEYWLAAGLGGGLNSVFHMFAKTGAFGRREAVDVTERAVTQVYERINILQKDLKKAKSKTNLRARFGGGAVSKAKVKEIEAKIQDELQVIALIQDFGDEIKVTSKAAEKQEITPSGDVVVKPDPIEEPEVDVVKGTAEQPTPSTKEAVEETTLELPLDKTERVIKDLQSRLDTLQEDLLSGKVTAADFNVKEWAAIVNKAAKLLDSAEFNSENAIRSIIGDGGTPKSFKELQQALEVQIKVIEFKGPVTQVSGNVVNFSNIKKSIETETADFSRENAKELDSLRNLKKYVDSIIDKSDDESFFAETAREYLDTKDTLRRNQRKKAREEAKGEQVVNLETRVKELEEKLAEKKAVAAGKPAKQPKTAKEKAEAQLEKEQQDFVEGKQDEAPKKAAKEEDAELQELRERIAFYKKNKKEAAEIEELEASIDRLSKLGKEGDPEKISKLVSSKPKWAGIKKAKSYLEDLRGVDKALRRELKESLKPQKTPEERMQDALSKRIQKLEKQLEEARGRAVGPDAKAADELVEVKPAKKEDTVEEGQTKIEFTDKDSPEVKELQAALNTYKRFEREAANYDAAVAEAERLKEILKRGDTAEMQQEVGRMPDNLKDDSVKSAYDKAVEEVKKRKAVMRRFLTEASKKEGKKAKAARDKELYERYLEALESAKKADKINPIIKGLRALRISRKMAFINSITSAMAAIPTGVFEVFRNFIKPISTLAYEAKDIRGKLATAELFEAIRGLGQFLSLLNAANLLPGRNANQVQKMFGRSFKEGVNPQTSKTRFELGDSNAIHSIYSTGIRKILTRARNNAQLQEEGVKNVKDWISRETFKGAYWSLQSLGMRSITAFDSAFTKINLDVGVRSRLKQKALLEFPNDPKKAESYFQKLLKAAKKDSDGLTLYDIDEELNDVLALVQESMLMAASKDSIVNARKTFIQEGLDNATKWMNNDERFLTGLVLETFMPFMNVAVRGGVRSFKFSGGDAGQLLFRMNPFNKIKEGHAETIADLKKLRDVAKKQGRNKDALNLTQNIAEEQKLLELADTRRVMHNKDLLTNTIATTGLVSMGIIAAKLGMGNGSNAFLTPEQKAKQQKTTQSYTFFGMDIRSWAPFNAPLILGMDLGNYFKKKREGKLHKNMDVPTVAINSFASTFNEMPFNQGVKQIKDIFGDDPGKFWGVMSDLAGGFVAPVPAQVRKRVETAAREGTLNDLRSLNNKEGFFARIWYNATGAAAPNRKRDVYGRIMESGRGWQNEVNRFADKDFSDPTFAEKTIAGDKSGTVVGRLSTEINNVNLFNFVNEDGYSLYSAYADIVENRNILNRLNDTLTNTSNPRRAAWLKDLGIEDTRGEDDEHVNLGLLRINSFIRAEHSKAKKELTKNKQLLKKFINQKGQTAFEVFEGSGAKRQVPIPSP